MGLFKKNKKVGLIADVIRCDEPSYLIWKWRPDGTELGEHKREYAIRCGSLLRVKDSEVAVFVYKQKDGTMQDYIVGPYDEKLKTANLPVLSGILGAFVGGDTPFQAEVFFINLANIIQTKFGVPYFDVCDFRFPDYTVPVAVRGSITFRIADYKKFIKLHRLDSFSLEDFQKQIRDAISRYVKTKVASISSDFNVSVLQIEGKVERINDIIEQKVKDRLKEDFGVEVSRFDIADIEIDKTSSGYRELIEITKEQQATRIKADTNHYEESLRIQREEGQYAMHKQTQSANIGAYQVEKQTEVGIAGAEALGKMGSNNAGDINLGSGAMGFNPASMMASIAVGGVVGKSIAETMSGSMSGVNGTTQDAPPIPKVVYSVAKDGKPIGPFDLDKLKSMILSGEILPDTLVWRQGMENWVNAGKVEDLKGFFPPKL